MHFSGRQHQEGQSLIEVVIAVGIFAVFMSSGLYLFFTGQSVVDDALQETRALGYARAGQEGSRAIRDRSWAELAEGTHGLVYISTSSWQFSGASDSQDWFTREVEVSLIAPNIKKVLSRVSWTTNRTHEVEIVEHLTNWRGIQETGNDTGGDPPSGDWQNPQTLGSVDLGPGQEATDLDVKDKIVYLSSEASAKAKPDFFVVDATNSQDPQVIASLNTGAGLKSIDAANAYAYTVGKGDDDAQKFIVINISTPSSPYVAATLDFTGDADALTVFYHAGFVYVGRSAGAAQEFVVIDVTNPLQPQEVAALSNVGGQVNDIFVFGQYAYLATDDPAQGLIVVDISSPTTPQIAGSLNTTQKGYSVALQAASKTIVGEDTMFRTVDASDPSMISVLGSADIGSRVWDIDLSGQFAFLGTSVANKEFQVWNLDDPAQAILWSSFNFPQVATGVDYEDNLVYVSVRSNDALRIITSP